MIMNVYSLNPLLRSIQMIPFIQLTINAVTNNVVDSTLGLTTPTNIRDATALNRTATNPAEKLEKVFTVESN